jgi:phosphatidylglycerophosphatase C
MPTKVALFDFDGTLTKGDSLLRFLYRVRGGPGLFLDLVAVSPWLVGYLARLIKNDAAKQALLKQCLGGRSMESIRNIVQEFIQADLPTLLRTDTMRRLRLHQDRGDMCILVSASLDLYLEPWAQSTGFHHVIATRLEVDSQQRITGCLKGENCYGQEKVVRIRKFLADLDVDHITAYGDSAGDAPMLAFSDTACWVSKDELLAR